MAAIAVGSDRLVYVGKRHVVKTSAGIPYVITYNLSGGYVSMFKGNSVAPTAFSEQDSSNRPDTTNVYWAFGADIDSNNIIHISFFEINGASSYLKYTTFDTSTDTWGSIATAANVTGVTQTTSVTATAIAVDDSDVPHIAFSCNNISKAPVVTVFYVDKVGGSWNSMQEVYGQTAGRNTYYPSICIDKDGLPCVSCFVPITGTYVFARGNANQATSFDIYNSITTSSGSITSIVCNSSGNVFVAYSDDSDNICFIEHDYADDWDTWQAPESSGELGILPSAVVYSGSIIYIFYHDLDTTALYYDVYDAAWDGQIELESGTAIDTVQARWSSYDNYSYATNGIDYVFNDDSVAYYNRLGGGPPVAPTIYDVNGVLKASIYDINGVTGIYDVNGVEN